jgi:fimbrial chaperone protein
MGRVSRTASPAAGAASLVVLLTAVIAILAAVLTVFGAGRAQSQQAAPSQQAALGQPAAPGLTVLPVSFEMTPGQMTAVLNVENHTAADVDFQVRPFAWDQASGEDKLTPTDALMVSPPAGRIPVGGKQVVRLVLRKPAQGQETPYRILLDQVPPAPQPGVISMALRLSIPVFAEPKERQTAKVQWSIQSDDGANYLVAVNRGGRHEAFRDMELAAADGSPIAIDSGVTPYVLPGATRRWRILAANFAPPREGLRLTARAASGQVVQMITTTSARP